MVSTAIEGKSGSIPQRGVKAEIIFSAIPNNDLEITISMSHIGCQPSGTLTVLYPLLV